MDIGQQIEVTLPGEPPFFARIWKDTNPYTLWYETADGRIDFAAREYISEVRCGGCGFPLTSAEDCLNDFCTMNPLHK